VSLDVLCIACVPPAGPKVTAGATVHYDNHVHVDAQEAAPETRGLLKENIAARLREEILAGRLVPGEKIVEGRFARQYGVAQVSIREALNILTTEGFVTKGHGRSARVLKLGDADITHIYEIRGALEGLAARMIVERKKRSSIMTSARWWSASNISTCGFWRNPATLSCRSTAAGSSFPYTHSRLCGLWLRIWTLRPGQRSSRSIA
jgi:DNA-binding transcriptional regulator YhcF (GntR family)